jgi:hypothetical protein
MKQCIKCEQFTEDFLKDRKICRQCRTEIARPANQKAYQENKNTPKVIPSTKLCFCCKTEKESNDFYINAGKKDGLDSWCKICRIQKEKTYRLNNLNIYKERASIRAKTFSRAHPKHDLIQHAKQRAKRKQIEFSITENDFEIPAHCPVLGIELCKGDGKVIDNSPSIDRIDSNKGYIPGNIMVISYRANCIKHNGTIEEHQKIVDYMKKFLT